MWHQRVKLHVYPNYWRICTSSPVQARTHANLILRVLQHLGWVINFSKSDLSSSQQFNFIGMQFSMSTYTVTPLPKMGSKSRTHWKSHPRVTARDLHKILGILTFIVRRAGLLWSQQDFEWRWSVPLFKCLTVLEFSFILFDLCLLITFFNFIMNYVPIVTFWIFTYHKIWILSIMFCSIWSYWIIYFLACLEVSWRVVS